jgi:Tfp pilus assembly protein PilF
LSNTPDRVFLKLRTSKFIGLALAASLSAGLYAVSWQKAGAADEKDSGAAKQSGLAQPKSSDQDGSSQSVKDGSSPRAATDEGTSDSEETAETKKVGNTKSETPTSAADAASSRDAAATTEPDSGGMPAADKGASETDPADLAVMGAPISAQGNTALQHYDMARHYFSQWQLGLAEVEFEVAIMYAPNMKIAHRDYSLVSLLRGHPIRAFAEALMTVGVCESIPLNPDEQKELMQHASKVHYSRGLLYAKKTEWNNAITELDIAANYTPTKPAVMRSLAFCYASEGDFTRSEQEYNKVFKVDPDDAFSHADFAYTLVEHGQADRAERQLKQALQLAPQAAALHVDLGWLAERKGDFSKAQGEFEEAIKLCPKQPGLWLQLGKVLERAGKQKEAGNAYKEVLVIDSSEDEARNRLQALNAPSDKPPSNKAKNPS